MCKYQPGDLVISMAGRPGVVEQSIRISNTVFYKLYEQDTMYQESDIRRLFRVDELPKATQKREISHLDFVLALMRVAKQLPPIPFYAAGPLTAVIGGLAGILFGEDDDDTPPSH